MGIIPGFPHHIWAADFTEVWYQGKKLYVATVIDLYTRQIVGIAVSQRKGAQLTLQALWAALFHYPPPGIFHSDNGTDYEAQAFVAVLQDVGSRISRSHPGCPWENGYQESFYDKFKIDLGDPNRFKTFGELIAEIYRLIWVYNHTRIRMGSLTGANLGRFLPDVMLRCTRWHRLRLCIRRQRRAEIPAARLTHVCAFDS